MNENNSQEFRFKRGSSILTYIQQFSSTEKVVFGIFALLSLLAALFMVLNISNKFLVIVPASGGELREGVIGLPRNINPVLAITDVDRDISSLVYSGLMKHDGEKLILDMAKRLEVSEDGLTYTFKLRDNVRFHDGKKLTTEDIAFTIQKIQDPALKSPRRADWTNITVRVVSPDEIVFVLKQPYAPFLYNTTIGIIPKHIWGSLNENEFIFSDKNISPIGSGPYKYIATSKDGGGIPVRMTLSSWRNYYLKKPYLNAVTFYFFGDDDRAYEALRKKTIDSLGSISTDKALTLKENPAFDVIQTPLPRIFGLFLNQNINKALGDKAARLALNMSVNRNAIVGEVLNGYGNPIYGPLPFGMSTSTKEINYDLEAAQTLLEKNDWKINSSGIYEKKIGKDIIPLSIEIYTSDSGDLKKAAEMVRDDWVKLGARVDVKIFETSDLFQNIIRTRKYDVLLFGQYIGKDRDLYAFWHSSQRNAPGLNVSLYANSKADKLLEEIRSANDGPAKETKFAEFTKTIETDIPAIFLYSPNYTYAINKNVKGIKLSAISLPSDRWNTVSKWYVNTEKVWKILENWQANLFTITNKIKNITK